MLIERDDTIGALRNTFAGVAETGGQIVLVCGEAGIGKSAVIEAFVAELPASTPRAFGLCDPLETPRPLGPVRDLFAALLDTVPDDTDEARYFDEMLRWASVLRGPAVLVMEDLHWADQRSLDWLNYVGRRISQLPILLLGSFRDDEVAADHPLRNALGAIPAARKQQLSLRPFSVAGIRQIASGSGFTAERLNDITGGNPFFVTEILSSEGDAVPISVSDAVNARINALPEPVRDLLEFAACCPGEVSPDLLEALSDEPIEPHLAEATGRQVLVASGDRLKFRHELARLTVYERLAPSARAIAHARILRVLLEKPGEPPLDIVVHHACGARDGAAVLKYAPRAAERAARMGAHRDAAKFLEAALKFVDRAPTALAAEIHEKWAYEVGLSLMIDDDVIAAGQKAVALWKEAGRPERVGESLRCLSRVHWYRGEAEEAQMYLQEALAVLENQALSQPKARAHALRAQFFMLQDKMEDAILWARQALDMADEIGDPETRAHALNTAGCAMLFRGDPDGEAALRESLAIARAHGLHTDAARVYTNLSECLIEAGELVKAEQLIEEGIAFDTEHDLDAWTFYLIGRKAQLRFDQDRYRDAIRNTQNVLTRENQTLLMRMPAMIIEARCKLRLGDAGARVALEETLVGAEKIGEPQYLVVLHTALIEAAMLAGDTASADMHIDWIAALEPGQLSPRKRGEFLFWAGLAGHDIAGVDTTGLPPGFAAFANGAFVAALQDFEDRQSEFLAAWTLVARGNAGDIQRADRIFERLDALGARRALRQRRGDAELPSLKRGQYRAARTHPHGLTQKEQIILRMLASGASNGAIARDLSRSKRTVENHVSSILSKMRAKSRLDVVLRTQNEPWLLEAE